MNKFFLLIIMSSSVLLTACVSSASETELHLPFPSDEVVTILFSDSATLHNESNYYNALLELQKMFEADDLIYVIVDSTERDLIRHFNVEQFPTILVFSGNDEELRVEGSFSKNEILEHLLEVYTFDLQGASSFLPSLNHFSYSSQPGALRM